MKLKKIISYGDHLISRVDRVVPDWMKNLVDCIHLASMANRMPTLVGPFLIASTIHKGRWSLPETS